MDKQELSSGEGYAVRIKGRTDDRLWDFVGDIVETGPQRVIIRTRSDPPHHIELTPRHAGIEMGQPSVPSLGGPETICALMFDGDYVALADYYEFRRGVLVVPYDYSPLWVYEASAEEQAHLAEEIRVIREELM